MSSTWWNIASRLHGQPLRRPRRCWTMPPRSPRPCKSRRPWRDWERSAACTAPRVSSKSKVCVHYWLLWILPWCFNTQGKSVWLFAHFPSIISGIAWIEFLNSDDNLGDILSHLREGDMKGAQLLWLRYEVKTQRLNGAYSTFCLRRCYNEVFLFAWFKNRDRLLQTLMNTNLKLFWVQFQRTFHRRTCVPGSGLSLSRSWVEWFQQDRFESTAASSS